jgi:hypothetical protein
VLLLYLDVVVSMIQQKHNHCRAAVGSAAIF